MISHPNWASKNQHAGLAMGQEAREKHEKNHQVTTARKSKLDFRSRHQRYSRNGSKTPYFFDQNRWFFIIFRSPKIDTPVCEFNFWRPIWRAEIQIGFPVTWPKIFQDWIKNNVFFRSKYVIFIENLVDPPILFFRFWNSMISQSLSIFAEKRRWKWCIFFPRGWALGAGLGAGLGWA